MSFPKPRGSPTQALPTYETAKADYELPLTSLVPRPIPSFLSCYIYINAEKLEGLLYTRSHKRNVTRISFFNERGRPLPKRFIVSHDLTLSWE